MNPNTERELKFSLMDEPPETDALRAALETAGYGLGPERTEVHRDRYFDTRRAHLARAGVALRERVIDGQPPLATFKGKGVTQGALHMREELELPLEDGTWPRAVRMKVGEVAPLTLLQPVLELSTTRTRYLVGKRGEEIAELSFDEVEAEVPEGEVSVHFAELEIEALRADADLESIARALDGLIALTPSGVNKVERAQALLSLGAWE